MPGRAASPPGLHPDAARVWSSVGRQCPAGRRVGRRVASSDARRHPAALALGGVLLVAAVLGFTKAEVERIWLMFVPLAAVAAAPSLPERATRPVLAALAVQTLATTALLNTLW